MSLKVRFGILSYVNCLPATLFLEQSESGQDKLSLQRGTPAELNSLMRTGALDVSLVSLAEYLQNEGLYVPLPGFSLWCDGAVESVCLYSPYSRDELRERGGIIGVTPQSATSVALSELLVQKAKTEPFASLSEARQGLETGKFSAILLIGDQALEPPIWTKDLRVHDLGAWWKEETGHPMTFAIWVARRDLDKERLDGARESLACSLNWGLGNPYQVLAEGHKRSGLSEQRISDYLSRIQFRTSPSSNQGFLEFRSRLEHQKAMPSRGNFVDRELVVVAPPGRRVTAL